ncbi:glycosyltransferase family 39 protein, partial [Candidatus Curtissbacteria bacterium]|nr:glycosyltransferase family 39 protein [Candidatus Curtissbacteria bacterium]
MKLSSTVASNWPILSVLLVSAFIHVFRLDSLITVGGDMGYDLIKIKGILDGDLTLLGSPIGRFKDTVLYLGPLYYYLQAPFLVLFKFDPVGLMIPIIIGRLTTTFFVYLIAKKLFNWQTAIIAAVISSVSPYFVEKLGPPSQPYVVPAVVALVTFLVISKKTLLTFALLGFASGLMIHFHYLGFSVFLALILFAFYGFKNHRLQRLTTLFLGFFLSISPVVLFELRNNFFLSKQIIVQFTSGVVSAQSSLLSDRIISAVNFPTRDVTGFRLPFVASSILLTISIVIALKKSEGAKVPILFLISIVVINLLAVSAYSQQVQPHYLASLYVPLFIFAGATIYSLARFAKILPIILSVTIFLALVIGNDLNRTSGYTMPEDLTLRQIRQIARIIAQDAQGEFNITSTLDGDSRALSYRYLVDVYGKKPLDVQTYDRGDSLYIITRDPARSVRVSSLFEIASFQPSFVENTWNINGDIKLIKLSKQKPQELKSPKFITLVNPVRPRQLWNEQSIKVIEEQQKLITDRGLKSTWLISYENLFDKEVVDLFKKQDHEIGAFLEVSEKWATDSRVVYKIDEGDYYRPDKVFLSGYSPFDRGKLIKSYFKKFKEV